MTAQATLALALAAPWLGLLLLAPPAMRRWAGWLASAAAAPALAVALLLPPDVELNLGLPLWGGVFGVDAAGRLFLFAAALIWGLCGAYAGGSIIGQRERARFFSFWFVALGGTAALIMARDLMSFYAGYAALTVAAYGLIIHDGRSRSRRAGRLYLAFMMIGEVALLAAVALTAVGRTAPVPFDVSAAAHPGAAASLFLVGFAIKLGVFGGHGWLPRAHPVAPVPASAVLSGAVVKAGALGCLRVLEGGVEGGTAAPGVIALGLAGAAYGVVMGLSSANLKVVLAWSTVSQMGLLTVLLGAGLAEPSALPLVGAAIALFAVHHGMAKASLFLGAGLVDQVAGRVRTAAFAALFAPALALMGAPLTTGWLAKSALDAAVADTPYAPWLGVALDGATVLTVVLMIWFLTLARRAPEAGGEPRGWSELAAFALSIAAVISLSYLQVGSGSLAVPGAEPKPLGHALWPLAAGAALFSLARALWGRVGAADKADRAKPPPGRPSRGRRRMRAWVLRAERRLHAWPVIGYLVFGALAALAALLWP